jgi:hypothetical protein
MGWVKSVECIIGVSVGIEELQFQTKEYRKWGIEHIME